MPLLVRRAGAPPLACLLVHTFTVNMLWNGTNMRTLRRIIGRTSMEMLLRQLTLANAEAIETHRVNCPADPELRREAGRDAPSRDAPATAHAERAVTAIVLAARRSAQQFARN